MMLRIKSGYTLVEISVALLILAIGFASLMTVFTVGLKWTGDTIASSSAGLAAESVIEEYTQTDSCSVLINPGYMSVKHMGYSMQIYNDSYPFKGLPTPGHDALWKVFVVVYPNDRARGAQANTIGIYNKFKYVK